MKIARVECHLYDERVGGGFQWRVIAFNNAGGVIVGLSRVSKDTSSVDPLRDLLDKMEKTQNHVRAEDFEETKPTK